MYCQSKYPHIRSELRGTAISSSETISALFCQMFGQRNESNIGQEGQQNRAAEVISMVSN